MVLLCLGLVQPETKLVVALQLSAALLLSSSCTPNVISHQVQQYRLLDVVAIKGCCATLSISRRPAHRCLHTSSIPRLRSLRSRACLIYFLGQGYAEHVCWARI